ncbi:hypothetical protein TIFTF001_032279 [Ficus carica]|uniref:Uncharacterized protein n=1 Tax=Ficus carica TaxID=3494 RepID=A0AA88DY53_FICCA|nr:hypothetical protein TIFTF001_032279 [Ficus carica]
MHKLWKMKAQIFVLRMLLSCPAAIVGIVVFDFLLFLEAPKPSPASETPSSCSRLKSGGSAFGSSILQLVFVKNSDEFVHEYMKTPVYVKLMRRLGALGDGNKDPNEWEVPYSYLAFVLRKVSNTSLWWHGDLARVSLLTCAIAFERRSISNCSLA